MPFSSPRSYRDPAALVLLTAASRIPFFAKTLFEFDSVNYAVALFRFDPSQDTPHLPGYLLHVGIAKLLYAIVGDANLAYVLESFFLSIGSVLCVWWCIRMLAPRGVALGAALVWMFNPIFWFYGCVASAYAHEAFFTAAVAALCVKYVRDQHRESSAMPIAIAATVALAGAARQTSLLFLTPAVIVAFWSVRPPMRVWLRAAAVGVVITVTWGIILIALTGGLARYIELANQISIVQYNSVFLHGTPTRHLDMISKMTLYMLIGTAPIWTLLLFFFVRRPREIISALKIGLRSPSGRVIATLILVPLAFYTLIFYAKSGYLLNIFVAATIAAAVLLHRLSTMRRIVQWSVAWVIIWIAYFLLPWPGTSIDVMHKMNAIASTSFDVSHRFPMLLDKLDAALTKFFMYSSSAGIRAFDVENTSLIDALNALPSPQERQVLIATRGGQWALFYRPQSAVYDVTVMPDRTDIASYYDHDMIKQEITDSVVTLPQSTGDVVLTMWSKHWDFADVQRQVHLEKIAMPEYLDTWRITDEHFRLTLGRVVFVK